MQNSCRAAVIAKKRVKMNPSAANLEALANVYMEQGLHEDAVDLLAQALKTGREAVVLIDMNQIVAKEMVN